MEGHKGQKKKSADNIDGLKKQPEIENITCSCELHRKSYRIQYIIKSTDKCFGVDGKLKQLMIKSDKAVEEADEPWRAMKNKTIRKVDELVKGGCNLNIHEGLGALYMSGFVDSLWENLYSTAKCKVLEDKLSQRSVSQRRVAGHETRDEEIIGGEWKKGNNFPDRFQKSRAKTSVLKSLEKSSGKSTMRAQSILSGVMSDLKKEPDFNENEVISDENKGKIDYVETIIEHASKAVKSLKGKGGTITTAAARCLTGFSAISIPQEEKKSDDDKASYRNRFMKAIGLNPRSKYVEEGLKNRVAFDQVMARRGQDIQSGEKIACRAGIGIFRSRQNGKLTITLLP